MKTTSWRKSSRSSNSGDQNCVEARATEAGFDVRDSKLGDGSPIFSIDAKEFERLLGAVR
jgi:hypothetical protein